MCVGDMSFMEKLLPESVKVHHMDSYNSKEGKRFQGSLYLVLDNGTQIIHNEMPLAVLNIASKYQVWVCDCKGKGMDDKHVVWTIWF